MYRRTTMLVALVIAAMGVMPAQAASAEESQQSATTAAAAVVVIGTVINGVESGCKMLRPLTGTTLYNITGSAVALPPAGTTVIATGEPRPGGISFCQQGIPFEVTSIRPILVSVS